VFGFLVAIYAVRSYVLFRKNICTLGAAVITNRYVLSAAHCFQQFPPGSYLKEYSFAMGHNGKQEQVFISKANRIISHKLYNHKTVVHDIALIELNRTIDFKNPDIGFICLPFKHKNDHGAFPPVGTKTYV
jgi:secreted trypsin-like serine protease